MVSGYALGALFSLKPPPNSTDLRSIETPESCRFLDFIDQSEALLQADYHIPAASLAGAVIEDTLRKLCVNNGITVPTRTNINGLNNLLARGDVYNLLTQKQITVYADIRNNADHGYADRFTKPDVEEMVTWVRRFTEQYLQ